MLISIKDFVEEGDRFHHCVFTNSYYNKSESLILSAKVNGKPVETVEVDLEKWKVVQSRGLNNRATVFNETIVNMVNSYMSLIKKRLKSTKIAV